MRIMILTNYRIYCKIKYCPYGRYGGAMVSTGMVSHCKRVVISGSLCCVCKNSAKTLKTLKLTDNYTVAYAA